MELVYRTSDGTIFESQQEAEEYEYSNPPSLFVIVDDDPEILEILGHQLDKSKIYHKTFLDPLEAMSFISKNRIAHVYTDFHMKKFGVSGKWIREICDQKNIPCSIVSGDASVADISKTEFMKNFLSYMRFGVAG